MGFIKVAHGSPCR